MPFYSFIVLFNLIFRINTKSYLVPNIINIKTIEKEMN